AESLQVSRVWHLRIPAASDEDDVYVLCGQSNTEGEGRTAELPTRLRGALPDCRIWNPFASAWQQLLAGVNNMTLPNPSWCGPELALAARLGARARGANGCPAFLVKFAVLQTALGPFAGPCNEWAPRAGDLYPLLREHLA